MEAARAILTALQGLNGDDLVVFLISGGGSSMVELFSDPAIPLETMAATHRALVECGAPIAAMNAVRKHLSAVKGGRLAAAAKPAQQLTIFVSDVPRDELDALASGPTLPDRSMVDDVYRLVERYGLTDRLPPAGAGDDPLSTDCQKRRSRGMQSLRDPTGVCCWIAHRLKRRRRGTGKGNWSWHVEVDNRCDDWTAEDAARYLLDPFSRVAANFHERVCLLAAGEDHGAGFERCLGKGRKDFALRFTVQRTNCGRGNYGSQSVEVTGLMEIVRRPGR